MNDETQHQHEKADNDNGWRFWLMAAVCGAMEDYRPALGHRKAKPRHWRTCERAALEII